MGCARLARLVLGRAWSLGGHSALAADRLTALLEPVLVLLLVGLVGMIALATVLPLMEAADVLQ